MIRDKNFKNKIALSPSRIDTFLSCSVLYAAKYIYKLPDLGNDGARRGSVTHDTLEILDNQRHRNIVNKVMEEKTCKSHKGLWKLIVKYAAKHNINNEDNLNQIDNFIYTALSNDFYGPLNTIEIFKEKKFDFEVETDTGILYRLNGFIDRSFLYKKGNNLYIKIIDWKTSKEKFKNQKKEANNQAICYQLATIRYLFPEFKLTDFHFLFLKFPKSPVVAVELKDNTFLNGYEIWLTHIQNEINNYSAKNINDNFAALKPSNSWLCGKDTVKMDGTPAFICSCRKPFDYYVGLDKDGKIRESTFDVQKLSQYDKIEKKKWQGCPYYFPKNWIDKKSSDK